MADAPSSPFRPRHLAALIACHWIGVVSAAPLSPALYDEGFYDSYDATGLGGADRLLPETLTYTAAVRTGGSLTGAATTAGGQAPSLRVDATANGGGGNYYVTASARIQYQIQLTGAPDGTLVPMTVALSGWATGAGDVSNGYGTVTIQSGFADFSLTRTASAYTPLGTFADSFDAVVPFDMIAGVVYQVNMFGSASTYQGSASAFVDPLFAFASPADAGRFTLQYSPGLISAVPEPSSAALGGIGLAALTLAFARRRPRRPGQDADGRAPLERARPA